VAAKADAIHVVPDRGTPATSTVRPRVGGDDRGPVGDPAGSSRENSRAKARWSIGTPSRARRSVSATC
jgi:hypothetical protein